MNPEQLWVRASAMDPLIPEKLFWKAQARLAMRRCNRLRSLSRLLKKVGHLSYDIVTRSKSVPSASTFRLHFGSLRRSYELIGYRHPYGRRPDGQPWTDDGLLEGLRRLHATQGYISHKSILDDPDLPSPWMLKRQFGSWKRTYERAGLPKRSHSEIVIAAHARRRERERISPRPKRPRPDGSGVTSRFSSEALTDGLQRLLRQHGYLSARLITSDPNMPSAAVLVHRFGSLLHAYELAGWSRSINQLMVEMHTRRHLRRARARRISAIRDEKGR